MLYSRVFHAVQGSVSCCTGECFMLYREVFHALHCEVDCFMLYRAVFQGSVLLLYSELFLAVQ